MRSRTIDLHGLTADDALATFVERYNRMFAEGYRGRIEVVHGYGSSGTGGVIRRRIRAFLAAHRDRLKHLAEGDAAGNPGVTYVEPKGRLPEIRADASDLGRAILAFCATPKTEAKILAKFAGRYGDPAIRTEIRQMAGEGLLSVTRDGRETKYVAAAER